MKGYHYNVYYGAGRLVGNILDAKEGGISFFEWTTELPTQEGWYWAKNIQGNLEIVYMFLNRWDCLTCKENDMDYAERVYISWLGPLPEPQLPKE